MSYTWTYVAILAFTGVSCFVAGFMIASDKLTDDYRRLISEQLHGKRDVRDL
jgi:hypothetical protein